MRPTSWARWRIQWPVERPPTWLSCWIKDCTLRSMVSVMSTKTWGSVLPQKRDGADLVGLQALLEVLAEVVGVAGEGKAGVQG